MEFGEFKDRLDKTAEYVDELKEQAIDENRINNLTRIADKLEFLKDFLDDEDDNIQVLQRYKSKMDSQNSKGPLYEVCKTLIDGFEKIYPFLIDVNSNEVDLYNLLNELSNQSFFQLLTAYKVLKHLDGHDKTLVILGPNGSGKTSFANYLKRADTHVKVIPASKPIMAIGNVALRYSSTVADYNKELYGGGVLDQELLQKLIIGMCTEHDDIARFYMDTNTRSHASTYERVKKIFDDFFETKLDNSAFSLKQIKARRDSKTVYNFNDMSDGERVAFFIYQT